MDIVLVKMVLQSLHWWGNWVGGSSTYQRALQFSTSNKRFAWLITYLGHQLYLIPNIQIAGDDTPALQTVLDAGYWWEWGLDVYTTILIHIYRGFDDSLALIPIISWRRWVLIRSCFEQRVLLLVLSQTCCYQWSKWIGADCAEWWCSRQNRLTC